MRTKPSLSTKLLGLGVAFLLIALGSIGLTLWVTWQLEGGAAAVNEAGRLRMNLLRMVIAQQNESPERVAALERQFDASLELLRTGDPARPLFVPRAEETRARFERVRSEWQQLRAQWNTVMPGEAIERADGFVFHINAFVQAIEHQIARWTAVLHLFQLLMVALAIAAAVTFMAVSYLLILHPVARLQQAIERLRQGDLGTRMTVDTQDEFGQLSAGFNLMAHALQESHDDLERKVREKTASIAEQNQRLAALYAVSALGAEAGSLEVLAQGFVRQIRQVADADAAAVRWSDEANERYVLLAADGMPKELAEREHCLAAGSCECGQVPETARMRVIPITPVSGQQLPHCREAGFETVVSIPVRLQQRVLGEVSLFFRHARALPEETRSLLATLVQHLASSMESLRASALEREAAVAHERSLLARELHDSIAQSLAFLKIQTRLLRDAIAKDNREVRERSLDELEEGVRECYADVRELLLHFRTRTSDEDIEAALRATLSKFEHQTGIATQLHMAGHGLPLDADVQIQVLHMVQEALSNVRKHAGASRVQLRVQRHPWQFEVIDDGCGFDPARVAPDSVHVGLGIMQERAQRVGAQVRVDSAPGAGGTRVCIALPAAAPLVPEESTSP
jgi:two-component system nitrate/nitrite sensor histidine kinase NarX